MNWNSRILAKILMPLALYNVIQSLVLTIKEENIFKGVINENDDFYKALATYGFAPRKRNFGYSTTYPINDKLSVDEIKAILDTQIIKTIKYFTESEMLLGVVSTYVTMSDYNKVGVAIRPKSQPLFKVDLIDFIISFVLWSVIGITILYW